MSERHPRVLAIDAGGTMTDTFIVDASGQFIVGKAQTTPEDEEVGFMRSAEDALDYWNLEPGSAFPQIVSGIYSGTAMLNRLLERKGRKVGCIVSGGLEDYFKLERGIQTYLSFPYSSRASGCGACASASICSETSRSRSMKMTCAPPRQRCST
jgi:N-methylhydantoinase A/acetone carboxylase beta subunit